MLSNQTTSWGCEGNITAPRYLFLDLPATASDQLSIWDHQYRNNHAFCAPKYIYCKTQHFSPFRKISPFSQDE